MIILIVLDSCIGSFPLRIKQIGNVHTETLMMKMYYFNLME